MQRNRSSIVCRRVRPSDRETDASGAAERERTSREAGESRVQEGWERRATALMLSPEALATLLAPAFPGVAIRHAAPLGGGLANTLYRVDLAGRANPVVVRLHTRSPAACQIELACWRLTRATVPQAEILYADPAGDPPYLIMEYVAGTPFTAVLAAGDLERISWAARGAGQALAAIHRHTFPVAGFFAPGADLVVGAAFGDPVASYTATLRGLLAGRMGARLGADLACAVARHITERAERLATAGPTVLCHSDYKAQNLLVGGPLGIAAVLDWEFAFANTGLFDLAILLRWRHDLPPIFTTAALAGYRDAGGSLPPDWPAVTRLLDLLNIGTFLDQPQVGPTVVADLARLTRRTLAEWDEAMD